MSNGSGRHRAMLLLGPTGSGKTPLGNLIEARGLWELSWVHFDFGAQLRKLVQHDCPDAPFTPEEIAWVAQLLQTGALLENEHFSIAERLLRSFLAQRARDPEICVVLNGLPRHVDQARAVDAIVDVCTVLSLRCTSQTVMERIRSNVAGDRDERIDDDPQMVLAKLALFHQRTAPVVEHYRALDVPIRRIVVTATMTPEHIWQILERRGG